MRKKLNDQSSSDTGWIVLVVGVVMAMGGWAMAWDLSVVAVGATAVVVGGCWVGVCLLTGSKRDRLDRPSVAEPEPVSKEPVRTVIRRRQNRKRFWYGAAVAINLVLFAILAFDACSNGASVNSGANDWGSTEQNPLQVR